MKTFLFKPFIPLMFFPALYSHSFALAQPSQDVNYGDNTALANIHFPGFYIQRRVHQTSGVSDFKLFRVNPDGSLSKSSDLNPNTNEDSNSNNAAEAEESNDFVSPSGKWAISKPGTDDQRVFVLNLFEKETSKKYEIVIPTDDSSKSHFEWSDPDWWAPISWNPKKELFYLFSLVGPSNVRQLVYWQFDPSTKKFLCIGAGQSFNLSPDGNWVVWTDGYEGSNLTDENANDEDRFNEEQIHIYDVKTNEDYQLTNGYTKNNFFRWAEPETPKANVTSGIKEIMPAISEPIQRAKIYIQSGKKEYLNNHFEKAIARYQKAIQVDPKNAEAYGLLGYSMYRLKNYSRAINALKMSISLNPNEFTSIYNLALAYWGNNEKNLSINELDLLYTKNLKYKALVEDDTQFKKIITSPEYREMLDQRGLK